MPRKTVLTLSFSILFVSALAFVLGRWSALSRPSLAEISHHDADVSSNGAGATAQRSAQPRPPRSLALNASSSKSADFARRAALPALSLAAEEDRQHLIEQWAEIDPRAAIDFARTRLNGDRQAQAISSVIAIWGKNDPAAAWTWVGQEMPTATYHFDTLLEVFGKQSTQLAAQYASQYALAHPDAAIEVNLAALMGVTYRGDFSGALDFIRSNATTDPTLRANLNNFLAGQWGRVAPTQAAAWAMSLPEGPERAQALIGLGESWSDVDPAGAAAFAATLPEGESRSLAIRQAIGKWVTANPNAAREWVMKTNATQDFDTAMEAIATQNNFMSREPAHAAVWATGIFNDQLRAKTLGTVLFNWYMVDQKAATNYLMASTDLTPEQKTELLRKLQPSAQTAAPAAAGGT